MKGLNPDRQSDEPAKLTLLILSGDFNNALMS